MFETNELNRIHTLEIQKNELRVLIQESNPKFIIKSFIQAKRDYRAKKTKLNQRAYIEEAESIAKILQIPDFNDLFNYKNTEILRKLEEIFDADILADLKTQYKELSVKLEKLKAKYAAMNTAGSNKKRLFNDTKNVLEYYSKKMPQINVIDEQIKVLNVEAENYKSHGLTDKYNLCLEALRALKGKKINVKKKFAKIGENSEKSKAEYKEKMEIVKNDKLINELELKKEELSKLITENSPSLIMKKYKSAKNNYDSIIIDLDNPSEIEQEYYQIAEFIADTLGLKISDLYEISHNKLLVMLNEKLNTTEFKTQMDYVNIEISKRKSKILEAYSTEDMLFDIFDYSGDETDGKVPKEILANTYIKRVQIIVQKMCYKIDKIHYYNEALSGGLMGLSVAINSWYEKQKPLDTALRFSDFMGMHVYNYAQRALYQMTAGGTTGSKVANYAHFSKKMKKDIEKRVDLYLKSNPNMAGLKQELIEELFIQEEVNNEKNKNDSSLSKPFYSTSETDYNAIVGGEDGNADMWGLSDYGNETFSNDDILDGKQKYGYLLTSISKLMDLFDVKQNKQKEFIVNENRKLMDIYDRQIFLMRLGLDYKKTKNEVESSKFRDKYTWEEIAQEIVRMKKQNGATNPSFSAASVIARWERMIKKIKIAVEMQPKIKAGLEFMLNYIDNNRNLMEKLSNDREGISIKNERDLLKNNYADNEDILSIEMLDGSLLGDDYDLSDENSMDDMNFEEL